MIVVEVEVKNKDIQIITGYGPQENMDEEKMMPFFTALEAEIIKGKIAGKSVIVEMAANSILGKERIEKEPHDITKWSNTKRNFKRQNLIVGNGSRKCLRNNNQKTSHKKE